jgi:arginase
MSDVGEPKGQVGVLGIPFALGGWIPEMLDSIIDMTRTPTNLKARGFVDHLAAQAAVTTRDAGDIPLDPPYCVDGSQGATNTELTAAALPTIRQTVADTMTTLGADGRLVVLGGECTIHPAVLSGLRDVAQGQPIGLVWFDAHGDFNTPETTETGSIWGFPLALACGRGDPLLVEAAGNGPVAEENCAHLGGHAMDEAEGRLLASSKVAHFGTGMLETQAGTAAFATWLECLATNVSAVYIAFDMDVLDASGGSSVALPEPNGMPVATALRLVELVRSRVPVVGIGLTTLSLRNGDAALATSTAVALAATGLGPQAAA